MKTYAPSRKEGPLDDFIDYRKQGGIAVITFENPPVNALGIDLRKGIAEAIDKASAADVTALVLTGGGRSDLSGTFFKPTVLGDVKHDMLLAREETFGPVAGLIRFEDEDKALRMANDTEFGLASYFYARDMSRIWRVAEALEAGMVGINTGQISTEVAPFGGISRKLGTNPICIGMPSNLDGPVLMDMASSTVALGKIALARNRKEDIPIGWIVDKDGNPTTDPNDYYSGGAILPVGVDQGHKGYALSFMVEVFSGLLTGLGFGIDPEGRHNDGVFIAAFNLEHFRPLEEFKKEMGEFVEFIKDSPPAAGFSEVLYPGEIEWNKEQTRRREGIFVEDETWAQLSDLMKSLNVESEVGQP